MNLILGGNKNDGNIDNKIINEEKGKNLLKNMILNI